MTQQYISSRSLIDFRARMARSPMLCSFGGGSARGFNPGVVGGGTPLNWGDYQAVGGSGVPSHNFAPSATTAWGYSTSVADVMVWKGNVDWVLYGIGGGGISTGTSQEAYINIYDLGTSIGNSGTLIYTEAGFSYAASTFYSYNFGDGGNGNGGTLPIFSASNYYQVEQVYTSAGGNGHYSSNKTQTALSAQGVSVTPENFSSVLTSGRTSNGTTKVSGQQFWIAAASADNFL